MIEDMVVKPRNYEREVMNRDLSRLPQPRMRTHYMYQQEPFSVRRKEFWPVQMAEHIVNVFIPERVSHEADGLIFQPWVGDRSQYIPNTCEEVLKWKYAHLNSVDFRLRLLQGASSTRGTSFGKCQYVRDLSQDTQPACSALAPGQSSSSKMKCCYESVC